MSLAPGTLSNAARRLARLRPDPLAALIVAAALLGAALALARQIPHGPAILGDSVSYVFAARNFLEGIKFEALTVDGLTEPRPLTLWPPLYPIALAAASLGALDPYAVAGPFNAAAFGLTILAAGLWMRRHLQSRFIAAWGSLALALSIPLGWLAGSASSEPLFTLLVTLALIQFHTRLRDGRWTSLFWAAALTAFAMEVKYIGVALLPAMTALLILQPGVAPRKKALSVAAFALISSAPVGAWCARNLLLVGLSPRIQEPGLVVDLPGLLAEMFGLLGGWLFVAPGRSGPLVASGLALVLLLALAAGAAWTFLREARGERRGEWAPLHVFGGFALSFIVLHLSAVLLGYTNYAEDGLDERHFAPLCVPFLFAAAFTMDRLLIYARERRLLGTARPPFSRALAGGSASSLAALLLAAGLLAWLALAAAGTAAEVRQAGLGWIRHDKDDVEGSDVAVRLAGNPLPGRTFTNWATLLILRTGPPARMRRWGGQVTLSAVREWIPQARDDDRIVWFYENYQRAPRDFGPSDLRGLPGLETVDELRDGVIFRVNPDAPHHFESAYASVTAREPDIRSVFDLYLDGRTLAYVKAECDREDLAAPFFLRVFPDDATDLPPKRRLEGFDDLGFSFDRHGARSDGKCVARRALPNYGVSSVQTGQSAQGEGILWTAALSISPADRVNGNPN